MKLICQQMLFEPEPFNLTHAQNLVTQFEPNESNLPQHTNNDEWTKKRLSRSQRFQKLCS